jgi:hypothetical protein
MTVLEEEWHFCFKVVVCYLTVDFHQMDIVPMIFINVYFLEVVNETIFEQCQGMLHPQKSNTKRNQDPTGMVSKAL